MLKVRYFSSNKLGALDIIRSVRPPEPYKGKGIRYEGEICSPRRKPAEYIK